MSAPRLRVDQNLGSLAELPEWSQAPRCGMPGWANKELFAAIKDAGFEGIQGGDPALCRELGLGASGTGRIDRPEDAEELSKRFSDLGFEFASVHLGTEIMSDATVDRLVDAVL